MSLVAGLGGVARNACVALATNDGVQGICEQERITRVKAAGFNPTGLPDEVLDSLLGRAGFRRDDVTTYSLAETSCATRRVTRFEHHFAHACSTFLTCPFQTSAIVICDEDPPHVSVWKGSGTEVKLVDWPWRGPAFAQVYSRCAELIGFSGVGREQRLEALARLDPTRHDERVDELFVLESSALTLAAGWENRLAGLAGSNNKGRIAASVQSRLTDLLIELLGQVARTLPDERQLCVGGSLFSNSYINTRIRLCGVFDAVYVPINPDNAGLAVGNALCASGPRRQLVTPFMGPSFTSEEVKATLDNCKLEYVWGSDSELIATTVDELKKGRLVGWFEGPMEWGARALGARSILANPFSQYVLDNLNRYLKQRDAWRGYALSGLAGAIRDHFEGPATSPFMECDVAPRDRDRFKYILPGPNASVRVQTVGPAAPPRFQKLLCAFGQSVGTPILVNTSFNGFQEPIVCSPRDAIRVFFGSGLDTLVIEDFVIRK